MRLKAQVHKKRKKERKKEKKKKAKYEKNKSEQEQMKFLNKTSLMATTIFGATQRCNIVATLFQMVATLFQHCNAVFHKKSS